MNFYEFWMKLENLVNSFYLCRVVSVSFNVQLKDSKKRPSKLIEVLSCLDVLCVKTLMEEAHISSIIKRYQYIKNNAIYGNFQSGLVRQAASTKRWRENLKEKLDHKQNCNPTRWSLLHFFLLRWWLLFWFCDLSFSTPNIASAHAECFAQLSFDWRQRKNFSMERKL